MEFFGLSGICKYIRGGTLRCKVNKFYLESSSNGDYTVTESNIDRQVSSKLRTSDSSLFVSQIRITGENDIYIYNYPNSSPQNPLTLTLDSYSLKTVLSINQGDNENFVCAAVGTVTYEYFNAKLNKNLMVRSRLALFLCDQITCQSQMISYFADGQIHGLRSTNQFNNCQMLVNIQCHTLSAQSNRLFNMNIKLNLNFKNAVPLMSPILFMDLMRS
ncbi:hypothetical protein HMI54_007377, partial [Coelomomyces lativittatus]